jgi:very-short-patch-repair endonuclease
VGERSKSDFEDTAVALLRRYGIEPQVNVEVLGFECDLVAGGVVIELDSEAFHDNPISAEDDTAKQAVLERAGRTIQRWTWDDVTARPVRTIRRLQAAIA